MTGVVVEEELELEPMPPLVVISGGVGVVPVFIPEVVVEAVEEDVLLVPVPL